MDDRLRVMSWALDGALRTVGDDPTPSMATRRRRDGRQAGDRHRRHRGLRPGDGRRRRRAPSSARRRSSAATATSAAPSSTRSGPSRRSSTPAASPSASPPTRCEVLTHVFPLSGTSPSEPRGPGPHARMRGVHLDVMTEPAGLGGRPAPRPPRGRRRVLRPRVHRDAPAAVAVDRRRPPGRPELHLATGIAVAFPRSPMVTAQTAWELAEATGGSLPARARQPGAGAHRAALRRRVRPARRPAARLRAGRARLLGGVPRRGAARPRRAASTG